MNTSMVRRIHPILFISSNDVNLLEWIIIGLAVVFGMGLAGMIQLPSSPFAPTSGIPSKSKPSSTPTPTSFVGLTATPTPTPQKSAFGFNTHLSDTHRTVSDLSTRGMTWMRIDLPQDDQAPTGSTTVINWNTSVLSAMDQAIDEARAQNMKVFLVTFVPQYAKTYSLEDYKKVTTLYYDFLSKRYKDKVAIWQIFNEADIHTYKEYVPDSTLVSNTTYMSELSSLVEIAKTTIHTNAPSAKVTVNLSAFPVDTTIITRSMSYLDILMPHVDIATLDLYPQNTDVEINRLPAFINDVKTKYHKDVVVGEFGFCTVGDPARLTEQKDYLVKTIQSIKQANPSSMLLYMIQDNDGSPTSCEATYGIKDKNGNPKPSYTSVLDAMK